MLAVLEKIAPGPLGASALDDLCRACGVQRLHLFGSAAVGTFDPVRSDLDFLVTFAPEPPGGYSAACFKLTEGLAKLFGRPIDLISERSIENPYLKAQILSERQLVFEA